MAHFLLCTNQNIDNGVQVFSVCKLCFRRMLAWAALEDIMVVQVFSKMDELFSWSSNLQKPIFSDHTTREPTVWTQSRSSSEIEPANSLQKHNPEWACSCELMAKKCKNVLSDDRSTGSWNTVYVTETNWFIRYDCDGSPQCLSLRIEHCLFGGLSSSCVNAKWWTQQVLFASQTLSDLFDWRSTCSLCAKNEWGLCACASRRGIKIWCKPFSE